MRTREASSVARRLGFASMLALAMAALGNAAHAQSGLPDTVSARSLSGQFVVHGLQQGTPPRLAADLATNAACVELRPALLAVSSERVKQAIGRELGDNSPWRGKIHLVLKPATGAEDPVTIVSQRFRDGWNYRVELPQYVERVRFVRALVQTILAEMANRQAGNQPADIPVWLLEGLTQQLLASSEMQLILPPPRLAMHGLNINPVMVETRRNEALEANRNTLRHGQPHTIEELSWPTEEHLSGDAGDAYRSSAQLLVTELLRLNRGRECLRAMLDELAGCYNWQTAFFRAFQSHFRGPLDLEKWWSLQLVHFTGQNTDRLLTLADGWRQLDDLLRVPVEVRRAANELPASGEVTLQTAIREWNQVRQTPPLQQKLRALELARLRASPELAPLVEDYRQVLGSYLRRRDQVGLILTSTTRDTNAKLRNLIRDTVRQLDTLDARRMALKPEPPLPTDAVEAGAAP
ncbi:MAG: hypothetical protein IH623_13450 [Verrucomicrobia bacterium]|nr:hypothetical protein [Verrucomicrobiota bacterium]